VADVDISTLLEDVELLFVQNAGATTLTPGADGTHTLSLSGIAVQTLTFANRPSRVAGAIPTETFVGAFDMVFGDDPPNAALVAHAVAGADEEEVLIVELMNPAYDEAAGTLVYDVVILEADSLTGGQFESEPLTELDAPREYAEAHLFIDDVTVVAEQSCNDYCLEVANKITMGNPTALGPMWWVECLMRCAADHEG
jgi:hypothetical protein